MEPEPSLVRSHRDLEVWERAVGLSVAVYRTTMAFPREEVYGLTAQLRRAAVSVAANIAEGSGRRSTRDFLYFLSISRGSLREVDTLLEIACRLGYEGSFDELKADIGRVGQMLFGLVRALERRTDL